MGSITFYDDIKPSAIKEGSAKFTSLRSQMVKSKVAGGEGNLNNFITRGEFQQFDEKITDRLNNILIDTNKIEKIEENTDSITSDLSRIKVSTNTLESDFSSVKSDVTTLKTSADSIKKSIKEEFKAQQDSLNEFRTEIKGEVINFKTTTTWAAIGVCATILLGAGGIITALVIALP